MKSEVLVFTSTFMLHYVKTKLISKLRVLSFYYRFFFFFAFSFPFSFCIKLQGLVYSCHLVMVIMAFILGKITLKFFSFFFLQIFSFSRNLSQFGIYHELSSLLVIEKMRPIWIVALHPHHVILREDFSFGYFMFKVSHTKLFTFSVHSGH